MIFNKYEGAVEMQCGIAVLIPEAQECLDVLRKEFGSSGGAYLSDGKLLKSS